MAFNAANLTFGDVVYSIDHDPLYRSFNRWTYTTSDNKADVNGDYFTSAWPKVRPGDMIQVHAADGDVLLLMIGSSVNKTLTGSLILGAGRGDW